MNDPAARALARDELAAGNALFTSPRWRDSERRYRRACELFDAAGDVAGVADATCNIASVRWRLHRLDEAGQLYERARELYVDLEAGWHVAKVEQYLGNVAYDHGDLHRARWMYQRALTALTQLDCAYDTADAAVNLAAVLTETGDTGRALALLDDAEALYRSETDHHLLVKLAQIEQNRALAHQADGDLVAAWTCFARALAAQQRSGDREKVADLLHNLANVASRMGRRRTAQTLYERAIAVYAEYGDDRGAIADAELGMGALLWRQGDPEAARPHLRTAARAFRRAGAWLALAHAEHNLGMTYPVGTRRRLTRVCAAWLALQSIAWGLPESNAREHWRDEITDSTDGTLEAALVSGDARRVAEIIEALRGAPLVPAGQVPTGLTAAGTTVHDHAVGRPALVDCGWMPALSTDLKAAESIRNAAGTSIALRTGIVSLTDFLSL